MFLRSLTHTNHNGPAGDGRCRRPAGVLATGKPNRLARQPFRQAKHPPVWVTRLECRVHQFLDSAPQVVAGDEVPAHVAQGGLGFAVLAGGDDRADAHVCAEREQAQQEPASQCVAVDHLSRCDGGELAGELGEVVGVLEHIEQVEGAQRRVTSSLILPRFAGSDSDSSLGTVIQGSPRRVVQMARR